ncbi:MAG: glycoside hydrolase family 26 protein, partial [Actinomycetota bacterium]
MLVVAVFALLWTGVALRADAGTSGRIRGPLVPAGGALLGTTVGPPGFHPSLGELEGAIGRKFAIVQHYYGWTEEFPGSLEQSDLQGGRVPMIGWVSAPLDQVLSGSDDAMIRDRADGLKALGHQVFLRWGYEMNGTWFPWAGSPDKFVAAWKHIHDIFTGEGANNVVWVWAPNWEDRPGKAWNHWTNYYPGNAYVDWVGIDGFNWGATQGWSHWTDIEDMLPGLYQDYHRRKPIMVAETASVEQGGDKAQWIA